MAMNVDLKMRLIPRLIADYHFKSGSGFLQQGRCPDCGKKELWTSSDSPWYLRCNRLNKCGAEYYVKDLYPEEFTKFNERYPSTQDNPMATATAYLKTARALDVEPMLKHGYFEQGEFYDPNTRKKTATVKFPYPDREGCYFERLVEPVELIDEDGDKTVRKQNFIGSYSGLFWKPPEMTIEADDEIWITEAIIDAISLWQNGIKAVAALSSVHYPKEMFAKYPKSIYWVWALDNDHSGLTFTVKHVNQMKEEGYPNVGAAICPAKYKRDWNDLHKEGKLKPEDIEKYRLHGAVVIAESALKKGILLFNSSLEYRALGYIVDFKDQLYWFSINKKKYFERLSEREDPETPLSDEEKRALISDLASVNLLLNARPEFLYYQRNDITDETWFYAKIHFPERKPEELTFTNSQVVNLSDFRCRIACAHGATWCGKQEQLDALRYQYQDHTSLKTVRTIDYIGYCKKYDCYVFPNVAVYKGVAYEINEQEYFDLPHVAIKTLYKDKNMVIQPTPKGYSNDWIQTIWDAFESDGMVVLAYWFASLFSEQIRASRKSFPFLEIIGEPGSGKTTILEFLWKLFGKDDHEGFDPNKSTFAGNQRKLSQYSCLPSVFIEADRNNEGPSYAKFDWEEIKPYYNGRGLRVRGYKNSGTETYEPEFRSSLIISQNEPVKGSLAVMQRIISITFTKKSHSEVTRDAANILERYSVDQLSHFIVVATSAANKILEGIEQRIDECIKNLTFYKVDFRVALNYAIIKAFWLAFADLFKLNKEYIESTDYYITYLCRRRSEQIASDPIQVKQFWEVFDYLNKGRNDSWYSLLPELDHSTDLSKIAINLNEVYEAAAMAKQTLPPKEQVRTLLINGKERKYLGSQPYKFKIENNPNSPKYGKPRKSIRCMVFENPYHVDSIVESSQDANDDLDLDY